MKKYLQSLSIGTVVFSLLFVALLLGVLPFTTNFMVDSKFYLVGFGSIAIFMLYLLQSFKTKKLLLTVSPYTIAGLALAVSTTASVFFTANYPVENLLGIGGAYLASALIILFGDRILSKQSVPTVLKVFIGSAVALSTTIILEYLNVGPAKLLNMLPSITIPDEVIFNASGANIVGLEVTVLALLVYVVARKHLSFSRIAQAIVPLLLLVGIGLQTHSLLPGQPGALVLPNATAGWSIALDSIRSPRQALIGVGPGNYLNAYNLFKPAWMNGTEQWALEFTQARSFPLTILTTMGFLGLATWLLLAAQSLRHMRHSKGLERSLAALVVLILAVTLVVPASVVLLATMSLFIALIVALKGADRETVSIQALTIQAHSSRQSKVNQGTFFVVALVLLAVVIGETYLLGRAYAAQHISYRANQAIQADNAVEAYELQQRAVQLNPYLDSLRRDYATTNLLIAIALSNKADATEAETAQIGQLLQQSIREGRAATALDPADTRNWLVLAQTYENMIGAAADAESFAVQSYTSAIETAPSNPTTRVRLAQVLAGQEQLPQAVSLYNQAINLKPDLPAPHYQLAQIFKSVDQLADARLEYQRLLTLLEPDSEDYAQVNTELEEVEEALAEQAAAASASGSLQGQGGQPSILEQNLETGNAINAGSPDVSLEESPTPETPPTPEVPDAEESENTNPEG